MTLTNVRQSILGMNDAELDAVIAAVNLRRHDLREAKRREMVTTLEIGDRVEISGKLRPKYLIGTRGAVTGIEIDRAWVHLDSDPSGGRYVDHNGIARIPLTCLTVIEKVS